MLVVNSNHGYRPDIEGLRALAVVPVVLFHMSLFCPGGFIGVDIFFVISGYLITQILQRGIQEGRLSIVGFYCGRIRRIFPAVFAMFAACWIAAYVLFLPSELTDFGKQLVASAAFSSNILLYGRSGYFDVSSAFQPLLHTWSLAVEEQFYIFWPLLLFIASRQSMRRWKAPAFLILFAASLLLSIHWVDQNPKAAFYLLPSRAWELLLGAALSAPLVARLSARATSASANCVAVIGLLMILVPVVTYSSATPFPGGGAVSPCLGTALIIVSGARTSTFVSQLLSSRVMIFIGKISYSLYLWHWPILVFGRRLLGHELTLWSRLFLAGLTVCAAFLSWRYIENPFRRVRIDNGGRRYWVGGALAVTVLFIATGGMTVLQGGFPHRDPDLAQREVDAHQESLAFQKSPCLARMAVIPDSPACILGAASVSKAAASEDYSIALWGDSHAAQLFPALDEFGKAHGLRIRAMTKAGCLPLPELEFFPRFEMLETCRDFNTNAVKTILNHRNLRVVVIAARWDAVAAQELTVSKSDKRVDGDDSRRLVKVSLHDSLSKFERAGIKVVLVGQTPIPRENPITCLLQDRFARISDAECIDNSNAEARRIESLVNELLIPVVSMAPNVQLVLPSAVLCDGLMCRMMTGGKSLYLDDNHLSALGSKLVGIDIGRALTTALTSSERGAQ